MNATDMDTEAAFRNDHETIAGEDPFAMFGEWLELAHRKEINDANAMALATADPDGLPNVRMVLLKGFDREGFVFYTNTESQKGVELAENMQAAAVLHWKSCAARFAFGGRSTASRRKRRMRILSPAPGPAGSAPGPANNHARSKTARPWPSLSRPKRRDSGSATYRAPRSGRGSESYRTASSSGWTSRSACMTVWYSSALIPGSPGQR